MSAELSKCCLNKAEEAASESSNHASPSAPPPYETDPYRYKFAVISFNMTDRIRLIQFPVADIDRIRDLIRLAWPDGVQNTRMYNVAYEFQLKGTPWFHNPSGNVKARKLIRMLLQGLYEIGWVHDAAVTMGKKANEKGEFFRPPSGKWFELTEVDTLVFRKHDKPMPPMDFFTISFDQMHTVTVHEGRSELCRQLIQRFKQAGWSKESAFVEDRMEIRLKELYWLANGEKTVEVRLMLLAIMEILEQYGFRTYASLRTVDRGGGEPDSLICCRTRDGEQDDSARDAAGAGLVDL